VENVLVFQFVDMQKYELILLLDHAMKKDERETMLAELEKVIKPYFLEKDDIGMQQLKYALWRDKQKDSAYFVCYNLQLDAEGMDLIDKHLLYNKSVLRSKLFRMNNNSSFLKFDVVKKELEDIIEGWGTQRFWQKVSFYANQENEKYLSWKAVPMLRKYVTRFGDIKPRRYTNSPVHVQKKIRKAILRAKELWLIEYIR